MENRGMLAVGSTCPLRVVNVDCDWERDVRGKGRCHEGVTTTSMYCVRCLARQSLASWQKAIDIMLMFPCHFVPTHLLILQFKVII